MENVYMTTEDHHFQGQTLTTSIAIVNSYVKSPEGRLNRFELIPMIRDFARGLLAIFQLSVRVTRGPTIMFGNIALVGYCELSRKGVKVGDPYHSMFTFV